MRNGKDTITNLDNSFETRTKGKLSKRAKHQVYSKRWYQAAKNRDVRNSRVNLS